MTLLDLVLQQIFPISLVLFVFGTVYRIIKIFTVPWSKGSNMPSKKISIFKRILIPVKKWIGVLLETLRTDPIHAIGAFLFHLPLFAILFLFAPHQSVIFGLFPFVAPILKPFAMMQQLTEALITDGTFWGPLDIIVNGDVMAILTTIGVIILLTNRTVKHALKKLVSDAGDYIALFFMLLILVSGYFATHSQGAVWYETMLVIHILSVAILIIYTPFSKFFHYIFFYWFNMLVYLIHKERRGA